ITNFNWSFGDDGTYSISITAMSMGDIIESLQSNKSMGPKISIPKEDDEKKEEDEKEDA
ncbi:hypothetical protein IIA15_11290, partial [candidate division TA06 bacterium]|nr:hypothetical protein [candidate division TA06 bacterium]